MKKIGTCKYCGDPIYKSQETVIVDKKKYHKGCYNIKSTKELASHP